MDTTPTANPDFRTIMARYAAHARTNRDAIRSGKIYGFDIHTGDAFDARTGRRVNPATVR